MLPSVASAAASFRYRGTLAFCSFGEIVMLKNLFNGASALPRGRRRARKDKDRRGAIVSCIVESGFNIVILQPLYIRPGMATCRRGGWDVSWRRMAAVLSAAGGCKSPNTIRHGG